MRAGDCANPMETIMSPFCLGVSVYLSACLQVCLWELFTRRLPWEGMAPLQVSTVARSLHGPRDASR